MAKGLTQEEVATGANISRSALHTYESAAFSGRIRHDVQQQIADALGANPNDVFPSHGLNPTIDRRQFLAGAGVGITALSMLPAGNLFPMFPFKSASTQLGKQEIQSLGDTNFSTWSLFDSAQSDLQVEYVKAVAQGQITALSHLSQTSLIPSQKSTIWNFLADMYMLLGRIHIEQRNYFIADQALQQVESIASETQILISSLRCVNVLGCFLSSKDALCKPRNMGADRLKKSKAHLTHFGRKRGTWLQRPLLVLGIFVMECDFSMILETALLDPNHNSGLGNCAT